MLKLDAPQTTRPFINTADEVVHTHRVDLPAKVWGAKVDRPVGVRATILTAAMVNALAFAASVPQALDAIPTLLAHDANRVPVLMSLLLASTTGIMAYLGAFQHPILQRMEESARRTADIFDAKTLRDDEHNREVRHVLATIKGHLADQVRDAENLGRRQSAKRRATSLVKLDMMWFSTTAPGPVTTIDPALRLELRWRELEDGALQIEPMAGKAIPESFQRLRSPSNCSLWSVIVRLGHDRASLLRAIRLAFAIDWYGRMAHYSGEALDLRKLDLRALPESTTNETMVLLPVWQEGGGIVREVLVYPESDSAPLAVHAKGRRYTEACRTEETHLANSVSINPRALRKWLGKAAPDGRGYVSAQAIADWLAHPPPTLSELVATLDDEVQITRSGDHQEIEPHR